MNEESTAPYSQERDISKDTKETSINEVQWEEVATTSGITSAQIIAGRLQAEGIPARAWQESAGQAVGLVVGILGTGHVIVPEEYVNHALDILEYDFDEEE